MSQPSLWRLGLCPSIIDIQTGAIVEPACRPWLSRIIRYGGTPLQLALDIIYSLRKPSSIAAATLLAAAVVTLAFYPYTAALLATESFKTCMLGLHHLLYGVCQVSVLSVGVRAYIRFSDEQLVQSWKKSELKSGGPFI